MNQNISHLLRVLSFLLIFWPGIVLAEEIGELFQKVNPAVVEIKTLFIDNIAVSFEKEEFVERGGLGSGVLISSDGQILTAAHVIQAADKIAVTFLDGQTIEAKVVTSAPWADIALLQLKKKPRLNKPVNLAVSETVKVGDRIFVIGAPYGLSHSLTVGYISSRHFDEGLTGNFTKIELFQTDAAVNSGNSGGPMFNLNGEVIGVVSHIRSRSGGFEGIGFAITSNMTKEIIADKGLWTGFEGYLLEGKMAEIFNLPQDSGMLIQTIAENSLASKLKLKESTIPARIGDKEMLVGGDIVLGIGDITFSSNDPKMIENFRAYQKNLKRGDTIKMTVLRNGKVITLKTKKG